MTTSPEILAMQRAYAARPYAASLRTSNCSCTNRFDTFTEARNYLAEQVARVPRFAHCYPSEHIEFSGTYVTLPGPLQPTKMNLVDLGLVVEAHGCGAPIYLPCPSAFWHGEEETMWKRIDAVCDRELAASGRKPKRTNPVPTEQQLADALAESERINPLERSS
jgi:hypothetical protein